jgi:hypothetical protein
MDEPDAWIGAARKLVFDFVQDDDALLYFVCEHSEPYLWESYVAGLSPQQAVAAFITTLQQTDHFARYKAEHGIRE